MTSWGKAEVRSAVSSTIETRHSKLSAAVSTLTWVGPYFISVAGSMPFIHEILDEVPQVTKTIQYDSLPRLLAISSAPSASPAQR